ncbi:MAG: hypothetical protein ACRC6U_08880 [Fusobacteriaceae bacterium]
MKEYLEKLFDDIKKENKRTSNQKLDNAFIEFSLEDTRKTSDEIVKNHIQRLFGNQSKEKDFNKFASIFKIESKLQKDKVKLERDFMLKEFESSFIDKNVNLTESYKNIKVSFLTYKAFLIELGNKNKEYKGLLRVILQRTSIRDSKDIVENLFKFRDNENLKLNTKESLESSEIYNFIELFQNLNSNKTDYLLDKLYFLIKEIENDSTKEKEFFLLKNLFRFFKSVGLNTIKKSNDEIEVYLKDIEDGEYIGEAFLELEKKKVIIERMGWKYKNTIISPVVYREIKIKKEVI